MLEIDRVLGAVLALARRTVSETIELSLELGADLWRCCVDPAQLQSAVLNLVINARDAMPGAGRVTIAARNETVGSRMPDLAAGDYVRLSVADTGRGMAPEVLAQCQATQMASLDEMLPECDFVSLHCPGGAENRHLINAARLGRMRPDAFLINTARGEVIDEAALMQALWFDTIGGAALDVFDGEPAINPQLLESDRLVMLPHLGSATREAREAMGFRVIDNLQDFFSGREPRDRVN